MQIKDLEAKKKADILRKVQKIISKNHINENHVLTYDIKSFPSSGSFSNSKNPVKHFLNERSHHHDQNEVTASERQYVVLRALDYLHSQQYFAYNNKSFNFCYSQVYSVRPPPFKV